jgi:hypothetical protein
MGRILDSMLIEHIFLLEYGISLANIQESRISQLLIKT